MRELSSETLFGIPYTVASLPEAGEHLVALAVQTAEPVLVAHSDVHLLTRMLREPEYREGLLHFRHICPDGMPLVWLLRRKGAQAHRLYGPDMMECMWDKGRPRNLRHFLLGSTEEAVALLQEKLSARFPGVEIAGHYCPPMGEWPEEEHSAICRHIADSGANCVWVAFGCPRQERWLYTNRHRLPAAVYFAVGAAFHFHAGLVRQAPVWIRSHGLEWLYRLCCEPRRLIKRYLVHNTLFLWYVLTKKI